MKKIIILLTFLFGFVLLVLPYPIQKPETVPIEFGINDYFVSIAALIPLVTGITQFLKLKFSLKGVVPQLLSWLVSVVLCFIGWLFGLGLFETIDNWLLVLLYGGATGLGANGFYDILATLKAKF